MVRPPFPRRLTLAILVGLGALAIARGDDPPADQQKKIAEVEKQLADLQKRLAELKKADKTPAAKKPLTLADADTWRAIRGVALSPDGKWFAHRVGPAEGDGEVVLRAADGKETRFPGGGGGRLEFSHDSKWFAFSAAPRPPRPGRPTTPTVTPAPRPKAKVVVVNLATGEKTEYEGVASFQFSGEAATHVALRKAGEQPGGSLPAGIPAIPGLTTSAGSSPAHSGTDLVLHDLATGADLVLGNVADFDFDKKGNWLVMLIDAAGQVGNGIQLRDMKTGAVFPIETAKAGYSNLTWNQERTAFTALKAVEDKAYADKWHSVVGFTDLGPKPTRFAYDPKDDKTFPKDMGISANRPAAWTDDLSAVVFGIAEQKKKDEPHKDAAPAAKEPAKKDDAKAADAKADTAPPAARPSRPAGADGAKPDLAIWHWKDARLQPMQEKQAFVDKLYTYAAAYRVKEKKFLRLADDQCKIVSPAPKQRYAIGRDVKPYQYMANLDGRLFSDVYVIDMATGERKKALTKVRYVFGPSPTGTHFLYYDDGHFHVYDMAAGKGTNVTEGITATSFVNAEDDHNVQKPPTFPVGWSRDGQFVLLSDGWDVWKVSTDGSGGENVTQNGKREGIRYQGLLQYEPDPKPGYDLSKPLYVSMYGEWTKKDGLGRLDPGKSGVNVLLWGDCSYGLPVKARDAEVFAFTRETSREYPDYYLADATFKDPKKVTDADPQQKNYRWSAGARLIEYKGVDGKRLQGALFLPADYEPGKKYPTIVYIYEKLSQGLHSYTPPSTGGFNKSIYTSNGYAVLTPDIVYRVNDPGKSAVECILPALDAAVATGVVDPARVGLHGHSWGGYQTAFVVTQTDRFKAAIAGAPLTDLVSMYSSVYWNTGSANQPIFESSQGRFSAGYWDLQDAYIRNSPVYFARNVTTPLVILHNDKDGAVDFTQGVEYYNTLRRLQKPVVMLQYKGENHGLVKPENRKDYAVRMREFFDHYLMGKPAPDWWAEGVPYLKMDEHLKNRK